MATPSPPDAQTAQNSLACVAATDAEIEGIFRDYDTNDDKSLSVSEVKQVFKKLKVRVTDSDLQALMRTIDTDGSNGISLDEFKMFYHEREAALYEAFTTLNAGSKQDSGLTAASLRGGLSVMNLKASDDDIRTFIERLDRDKDGQVSFNEFRDCMLLLPSTSARAVFDTFRDALYIHHSQSEYSPPLDLAQARVPAQLQGALDVLLSPVSAQLIGGAIAGAASRSGTAPLSLIVARSQVAASGGGGMVAALKELYAKDGTRGLFRGNGVNCMKVMPETAIKMFVFDRAKAALNNDPNLVSGPQRFLAGGFAGAVSQVIVYPLEVIKTRLNLSPASMYSGVMDCFSKTISSEGVRALFRGCSTSVVGIIPYAGIDLMMSSVMRDACVKFYDARHREPGPFAMLGVGVFSSTIAMTLTYPIGLVRTRLQASGMPGTEKYDSAMHVVRSTLQKDGVKGMFRGWAPTLFKVAPAAGISFGAYSAINDWFLVLRRQRNGTNASRADLKKSGR